MGEGGGQLFRPSYDKHCPKGKGGREENRSQLDGWMDGRCASMEASEREREGDARTAFGNGGERGARRLKHNRRRASLFDAQG